MASRRLTPALFLERFHRLAPHPRLALLFDNGEYTKVQVREVPQDPLKFRDGKRYTDRLKSAKSETELDDAVLVAEGQLEGLDVVAAAIDHVANDLKP